MNKNKFLLIMDIILFFIMVVSFKLENNDKTNFSYANETDFSTQNEMNKITINILVNGVVTNLDLEEYIMGVVAAEMPALFDEEALKAQAIVSRSYALYKKNTNSNNAYDLTNDTNSQVYISNDEMHSKWGDNYNIYYDKIKKAVDDTKNLVAVYNNSIACTYYFSISNGYTNNSKDIFGMETEYLKSVNSEFDKNVIKYQVETELNLNDFIKKLSLNCAEPVINYIDRFKNGYIDELSICDKKISGTEFRRLLNLRSSDFDISIINSTVKIVTRGYGHGVGMSQYGANELAKKGYTYEQIIKYYYQDIELKNI